MAISSLDMAAKQSPAAVMLTTSIRAKAGAEMDMRSLLETLSAETKEKQSGKVSTQRYSWHKRMHNNSHVTQSHTLLHRSVACAAVLGLLHLMMPVCILMRMAA